MPAPDQIPQGTSYYFVAEVCPELASAEYGFEVKRFPDDEPAITKQGAPSNGQIEFILTPEETETLDIGLWYLVRTINLPECHVEATKRVQITKKWA